MRVHDIAFSRSGDKGDTANICVFVYHESDWTYLEEHLTAEVVHAKFDPLIDGEVRRYVLPRLQGLNFVLTRALGGGVSMSLRADPHGKSYASLLLDIDIGNPDDL